MVEVRKAVIPSAGLGTRFLPATKATPKEMLPVIDKPTIQYVVEEAVTAGLTDILMVTGRNKRPLEDHFDRAAELEEALQAKGDHARLEQIRASAEMANVHYVRQGDPKGLGHAVLKAESYVHGEPFAVLLGDDFIDERDPLLPAMIEVRQRYGGSVVALIEVPEEHIHMYGCAAVKPAADGPELDQKHTSLIQITDLVEKPSADQAPSNLAVIGRYVLDPAVMDVLRETAPGRGGEIQLTDALRTLASDPDIGGPVHGVVFTGRRYDTGNPIDYLKTVVQLAVDRPDLGREFRDWLSAYVSAGFEA
ncbi:UTP--glucose-1-phosphate uridylyltransferase [Catenulispora sp. MAP12-49]|jgi:UTP--glucose-1-phosphate uridylyltransferase|uniref:UTP--glucose-1-phosphate uridylyltransferase GalU n=1 Tax=unclassified Catenulispora TaxID=414885 RepID=UPI003513CAB1